jgi:hypothetical protein
VITVLALFQYNISQQPVNLIHVFFSPFETWSFSNEVSPLLRFNPCSFFFEDPSFYWGEIPHIGTILRLGQQRPTWTQAEVVLGLEHKV